MDDPVLILKSDGGRWSAHYSDRPEDIVYDATMPLVINRLKQMRNQLPGVDQAASGSSIDQTPPEPDPPVG